MKLLSLIMIFVIISACGKKSEKKHKNSSVVQKFFVNGDPLSIIKGTTQNKVSFLDEDNIQDFNGYIVSNAYSFSQISEPEEKESIEDGEESEDLSQTQSPIFKWKKLNNTYIYYCDDSNIELNFNKTDGKHLSITSVKIDTETYAAQEIHYSITKDKSKFSFLFLISNESEKELISVSFFKDVVKESPNNLLIHRENIKRINQDSNQRLLAANFYFMFGPGVHVPWLSDNVQKKNDKKIIPIDVCPSVWKKYSFEEITKSFKAWEKPFEEISYDQERFRTITQNNKFEIKVIKKESCNPFSDVNEHSIQMVHSYITMDPNGPYTNPAVTLFYGNLTDQYILDADIILFADEIKKNSTTYNRIVLDMTDSQLDTDLSLNRTLTHEMGHFLGLHHNFEDETSVMSYSGAKSLGEYDKQAIKNLYQ